MAGKIICTNLSTYDTNKYDAVGMISSVSVHAISALRDFMADITGAFGGKNSAIEKKYIDIRTKAMKDLREKANELNADMLAGINFDISSTGEKFLVCMATGTVLVLKKQKGGKSATCKK